VFTAEKALREGGDKVPADVRSRVDEKVAAVKTALEGKDLEAIQRARDELYQVVQQVGASMYGQAGQTEGGGPSGEAGAGDGKSGDDVVEGEFKEA
jgi:molecular chaperone DnaK